MSNSPLVRLSRVLQATGEESWVERVRQNARTFFELRGAALAPGGAEAFDLLEGRPAPGTRQRQAGSLVVHALVIGILLWMGGRVSRSDRPLLIGILKEPGPLVYHGPKVQAADKPDLGRGSGGDTGNLAPNAGEPARRSQMVFLHPRIPDQQQHTLPVEPNVLGDEELRRVHELGLPWMQDKNNSNGRNGTHGIGEGPGHTMGIGKEDGVGVSDQPDGYAAGAYPVKCMYCPDPEYTDEARHEKLQGSVTLRVLVTADGRAGQVRIIKALGLGLDERAVDAVRKWRFEPARDATRKAVAEWVTVDATYRLF